MNVRGLLEGKKCISSRHVPVDQLIDRLGNAKYISTLDLTRGYWQVPVAQDLQDKTAFTIPFGLFNFTVMPFGLHGAPATFQHMMVNLLTGAE